MRILVTGRHGQLGRWLVRLAGVDPDVELVAALGREDADFARPDDVDRLLEDREPAPDWLINAAAYTAVDRCEDEEALATRVNAEAPGRLARACRERGIRFLHVSTDFVFDGRAHEPYDEDAEPRPLGAYGRSKRAGEVAVLQAAPDALVVRTSWVFGPGPNFVRTILHHALRRRRGEVATPLSVVADQRGRPTYAADLARGCLALARAGARGLVHLANAGEASWWELARAALDEAGLADLPIERIAARDWPRRAPTPAYSVLRLDRARSLGVELRPWREALADYLASADSPLREEGTA